MKNKKINFLDGKTIDRSPRFGVIYTKIEKDKTKFSRKEKHKKSVSID